MSGCFKWVVIVWTVLIGSLFLIGMVNVGGMETNSMSEAEAAGAGIGVTLGVGVYFLIWAVIAIPSVVLYFVLKPSTAKALACPHCGSSYGEGSKFCPSCGKSPT